MPTETKNRRKQARYSLSHDSQAFVEFDLPRAGGRTVRLPMVNLSAAGISFAVENDPELVQLEAGTTIPRAVARVGTHRVRGELVVMHVTGGSDSRYVCGALLYPATNADLVELRGLIAELEVAGAD